MSSEVEPVATQRISVSGVVEEDDLACYTPSVFSLCTESFGTIQVVDFDLRSRGDVAIGDRAQICGVLLHGSGFSTPILLADPSDGVLASNPPWADYYGAKVSGA
ncbi:hypothetical protein GCM10027039_08310 [Terrabacter koreensis]